MRGLLSKPYWIGVSLVLTCFTFPTNVGVIGRRVGNLRPPAGSEVVGSAQGIGTLPVLFRAMDARVSRLAFIRVLFFRAT